MTTDKRDIMRLAIELASQCVSEDNRKHPKVGAVIIREAEVLATGFRGEWPGSHAEYIALRKSEHVKDGVTGATLYTTLEPCTARSHPKVPCADRIVASGITTVVIGMLDPNPIISGKGVRLLRKHHINVLFFDPDLMEQVEKLNTDFDSQFQHTASPTEPKFDIDAFQAMLSRIYTHNYRIPVQTVYSYLCRAVGFLGKNVNKHWQAGDVRGVDEADIVRPLAWLFALATQSGVSMQDAFFKRYPRVCPHCLANQCICHKTGKSPQYRRREWTGEIQLMTSTQMDNELRIKYEAIKGHVLSFDYAADCINSVYSLNEVLWHYGGPGRHFFKLWEEISEVHELIPDTSIGGETLPAAATPFAEEIADILAWLLAIWNSIAPGRSLDEACLRYYENGCPACNEVPCTCQKYAGRLTNLYDFSRLAGLREQLHVLLTTDTAVEATAKAALEAIKDAEVVRSDSMTRVTLRSIAAQLDLLGGHLAHDRESHREALVILAALSHSIREQAE